MAMLRLRPAALLPAALALPALVLIGGALSPRIALAAPPPPSPPAGQNLVVMVVDIQRLLQDSKAAKMVRSQIEQKRLQYTREISRQEQALRAERDALQREQSTLSAQALNQKGRAFQEKVNALDRNVASKRQALEKSNSDALGKIQQTVLQIIADIAKERKANLVLPRSDLILFDKKFEVTDAVLQQLDQKLPTLTVSFATPAGTPAAHTHAAKSRRK
ncbi:MAG TPA: OmpH family outer membrane protein [Stellaceae bacterium]|nr:OmpH family outer membrane protein [Stellaceae bacterium]